MWDGHSCPSPLTLLFDFDRENSLPDLFLVLQRQIKVKKRRTRESVPHKPVPHKAAQRRRASTFPFLAIRATLARLMNRPCSTTPGMSLSWRARAGGSGIWPKEQSRM